MSARPKREIHPPPPKDIDYTEQAPKGAAPGGKVDRHQHDWPVRCWFLRTCKSSHNDDKQYIWGPSWWHAHHHTRHRQTLLSVKYLEEKNIKEIIKEHSEFISYPIQLVVTKEAEKVLPGSGSNIT